MAEYDKFLERVQKCPALKEGIDDILAETVDNDYLNLTHSEWRNHLRNDAVYQRHANRLVPFNAPKQLEFVRTQYVSFDDDFMKMVVIAPCVAVRGKSQSFLATKGCPPFDDVCRAFAASTMQSDLDLRPNAKLFVGKCCGPLMCNHCHDYLQSRPGEKCKSDFEPWTCISTTKVFNGLHVINVLGDAAERMLSRGQCWAILKVAMNCRQFYGDDYKTFKISGTVHEFILFPESSLRPARPKKMKFLDVAPPASRPLDVAFSAVLPSASISGDGCGGRVFALSANGAKASGVSFSIRAPGANAPKKNETFETREDEKRQEGGEEEEEKDEGEKNICLPKSAKDVFLEQRKREKQGEFDVEYETMKF